MSAQPELAKQPAESEGEPSFIDPTARVVNEDNVKLAELDYVGPFALLRAGRSESRGIEVGSESNVQDHGTLDAKRGKVTLGEQAIVAHGATVRGPASVGEEGRCPKRGRVCPSFVSFNAVVDGATVEKDAMVLGLARVARGVTIPSGRKVLPGKEITSKGQVSAKTVPVTEADREFMGGVVGVNKEFAERYAELALRSPSSVRGIRVDPGGIIGNRGSNMP